MQVDNNKISLRQLMLIGLQQEDRQIMNNPFAFYLSANKQFCYHNDQELHAKDTLTLPIRPIRRRGCQQCISQNLKCQICEKCHKAGKTCCRSIECIYELSKYLNNTQAQIYKKCECCKTFQPSALQFVVDWRLLYLLHKVGQFKMLRYSYCLHIKVGTLFISEQEVDQTDNIRKINRIVFEQSYGMLKGLELKDEIKERNLINLKRLFQRNILKYVKKFEDWKEDNIQGTCYEIIHKFQSNQHMQNFKKKMETVSLMGEHDYISGCSLSRPKKYINVAETITKINYNRFQGLSSAVNRNIIFFYHDDSKSLIVKNAKYEQKQLDTKGFKIYGIMNNCNYDLSRAIWFKDRKGDIFAFHQHFISIFKFQLTEKKFKQILLRQDTFYQNIVSAQSIIYIPQTDRVYFFDHNHFGHSYYFELYRPYLELKQFSDCLNVNPWISIPGRLSLFSELLFVKAVSVMQEIILTPKQTVKNQKQKTKYIQLIPVIYLLTVHKQSKQILKLYRLVHFESFYEIKQVKTAQQGEQCERECNQNVGIFTILMKEKQICVCMQTEIDGNPKLIEGRVTCKERLQVTWQIHDKVISNNGSIQSYFRLLNYTNSTQMGRNGNTLLINDVAGVRSNSMSRYLTFVPSENRLIELLLSLNQGEYIWQASN